MTAATTITRTLCGAAAAFGLRARDVCSQTRTRRVSDARAVAAWLFVNLHGYSLTRAANYLARHHTTVLHAVRRVDHDIATGGPLRRALTDATSIMLEHSKEIERCATQSFKSSSPASASDAA